MTETNLDARLEKLRAEGGWRLRRVYSLRRSDGDEVQNFYGDELEAVVKRAEANEVPRRPKPRRVEAAEPKPAELPSGWTRLEPVHIRPGEAQFGAEKLFAGDAKPVLQSSSSEAGLATACRSYDAHKANTEGGVEIDEAMARRLASSRVHTGLASTESHR